MIPRIGKHVAPFLAIVAFCYLYIELPGLAVGILVGIAILIVLLIVLIVVVVVLQGASERSDDGQLKVFSESYHVSRGRFRRTVRRSGGQLIALDLTAKGPKGANLTIDIGWFGAKTPKRVFIHSSGLHGVEGLSGSAIQLQWLKSRIRSIPADSAIVLVHALNPYGMAWRRRFNENNVDLNRNFRAAGEFAPAEIPYWIAVNALLNPATLPLPDCFYLRAAWLVLRHAEHRDATDAEQLRVCL